MRAVEWINVGYFALLLALTWMLRLPRSNRLRSTAFGAIGLGVVAITLTISALASLKISSVVRDWAPCLMTLLAYWQAGQFTKPPHRELQQALVRLDDGLFDFCRKHFGSCPSWLLSYLEFAYFFCYPMVMLGVGSLYLLHQRQHVDQFWVAVMSAAYACYLTLPFFQVLPPWMLMQSPPDRGGACRPVNAWINRHLSVHVATFPSGHVAASVATALTLLMYSRPVGAVFVWLAASIAASCVVRRYHFALDVVLGAVFGALGFALSQLVALGGTP